MKDFFFDSKRQNDKTPRPKTLSDDELLPISRCSFCDSDWSWTAKKSVAFSGSVLVCVCAHARALHENDAWTIASTSSYWQRLLP